MNFVPFSYPTIDGFAFAPVSGGMWRHHEVFDGTYDFDDLLDAHELMAVNAINKGRAIEAARREQEVSRGT